ncbi:MAG TPA: uroporphyrinogen-III C-methyltransferase [Caulobacteraceae bacterium]|nr:uroporphyrinogen-III C-methyltransferase [Caulobacteraceae bacterium]
MPREAGRVLLVGAGPGAADLLTVRALRAVETAQALLYDALVCDEVVALAPRACLKIRAGKRSGKASMAQAEINQLMLTLARRGLRVVRLKGGDSSVFGRSGEEAAFLRERGVAVEVVPGITAASAAAAEFGFPLTHRGGAARVVLATARRDGGGFAGAELEALADPATTAVLYMGREVAAAASASLIRAGRSPATPVLVVENAGRPGARAVRTTLDALAPAAGDRDGPTLIVIGEVAALAKSPALVDLRPFEEGVAIAQLAV